MTTNRSVLVKKLSILVAGLGLVAIAAGTAMAGQGGGGKRHYFKHVSAKLERALNHVNATPEQRAAIEQAKLTAFASIKPIRNEMKAVRAEIRQLKSSENPDQARLAELKAKQHQSREQIKAVAHGFMNTTQAQLSDSQRQALSAFVAEHGGIFQMKGKHFRRGPAAGQAG
jgi:hypothetical protein